jgi:hypothetical protein
MVEPNVNRKQKREDAELLVGECGYVINQRVRPDSIAASTIIFYLTNRESRGKN